MIQLTACKILDYLDDKEEWTVYEGPGGLMGYVDQKGDVKIELGKYEYCFTDTFKNFAIVFKKELGLIAIDKKENPLFEVYSVDNGPDYPSEGLFRITASGLIGYADVNGNIVIKPKYPCAFPFEHGKAKVSLDCELQWEGEHTKWVSENWFYIDKEGRRIDDEGHQIPQ